MSVSLPFDSISGRPGEMIEHGPLGYWGTTVATPLFDHVDEIIDLVI